MLVIGRVVVVLVLLDALLHSCLIVILICCDCVFVGWDETRVVRAGRKHAHDVFRTEVMTAVTMKMRKVL